MLNGKYWPYKASYRRVNNIASTTVILFRFRLVQAGNGDHLKYAIPITSESISLS